jgi:hypothetical protein
LRSSVQLLSSEVSAAPTSSAGRRCLAARRGPPGASRSRGACCARPPQDTVSARPSLAIVPQRAATPLRTQHRGRNGSTRCRCAPGVGAGAGGLAAAVCVDREGQPLLNLDRGAGVAACNQPTRSSSSGAPRLSHPAQAQPSPGRHGAGRWHMQARRGAAHGHPLRGRGTRRQGRRRRARAKARTRAPVVSIV